MTGIYAFSFPNGMIYIGKSENISQRVYQHKSRYKTGKHPNPIFVNACNKYGFPEMFVLEETYDLNIAEMWYIQYFKSIGANVINLTKGGDGGNTWAWREDEIREHIGKKISQKIKGKQLTPLYVYERSSKRCEITDPSGNIFHIIGLGKFCKAHGLCSRNMGAVANGIYKQYKGWKVRYI